MSCTTPSVTMIAPPTRSGGTSASAARSAANSRVPSVLGVVARRLDEAGLDVAERARAASRARRAPCRSARRARRWSGCRTAIDHDGDDVLQRTRGPRARGRDRAERSSSSASASARSHAPRTARQTSRGRRRPAQRPPSAIKQRATEGAARRAIDQALNAQAFPEGPSRGPGRPCSCRSACTSRD